MSGRIWFTNNKGAFKNDQCYYNYLKYKITVGLKYIYKINGKTVIYLGKKFSFKTKILLNSVLLWYIKLFSPIHQVVNIIECETMNLLGWGQAH